MAQRLATEYVKTCLRLKEAEMPKFIQLFEDHHVQLGVRILDNGSEELAISQGSEEEIVLSVEHESDEYIYTGSCRLSNITLANAMRKAVSMFNGHAVVKRIYQDCTMVYEYSEGVVAKISELKQGQYRLVYERKDTVGQFEKLYMSDKVEQEIEGVHAQINQLLDLRNTFKQSDVTQHIDKRLIGLSHKLFYLEG